MIHKSFSKQDLKEYISDLKINITNYDALNKNDLIKSIINYLGKDIDIDFTTSEYFKDKDKEYLKDYLSKPNPNKLLSVKERNDILRLCKEIIHYCKTGFCIENTCFGSVEELKIHMDNIQQHGDIPSVRRCCLLIKGDLKINETYKPVISLKVKKELEIKKNNKIKNKVINCLIIKSGPIYISFD
jgi:hypothetical protein